MTRLENVCKDCRCRIVFVHGPGWIHWTLKRSGLWCVMATPARQVYWRHLES